MKKAKYDKTLPRRMYHYFRSFDEKCGAPSFVKFAMANGYTLEDLLSFREHRKFELAYREANEIRRDYLIDHALCRQFDGSFVKFLLGEEGKCDEGNGDDGALEVVLTVVDG